MSDEARDKIKQVIQGGFSKKQSPGKVLRRVYEIVDNDKEWEEEEEYDEEEYEDEDEGESGEEDEDGEDEEDEEDEQGGFFDALIDLLPDEEE